MEVSQPAAPQGSRWQRLPTWAKWVIGVVGALLLLGIGGAIAKGDNSEDKLKDEVAALEKERDTAEGEAEEAEEKADQIKLEEDRITRGAETEADELTSKARSEATDLKSEISGQKVELEEVEAELEATRAEFSGAKKEAAKSTITDGVWKLEQDYLPGTYEAPGGGNCYWALLSEVGGGGVEGIIENGGFNKHQILTIESPYFETRSCGTWQRVE